MRFEIELTVFFLRRCSQVSGRNRVVDIIGNNIVFQLSPAELLWLQLVKQRRRTTFGRKIAFFRFGDLYNLISFCPRVHWKVNWFRRLSPYQIKRSKWPKSVLNSARTICCDHLSRWTLIKSIWKSNFQLKSQRFVCRRAVRSDENKKAKKKKKMSNHQMWKG